MPQKLEVCIVQTHLVWNGTKENLEHISDLLHQLTQKPDLIVLPEMFNTAFVMNPELIAERKDGVSTNWMKQQAQIHQAVIAGSICIEENNQFYNRFLAVYPDGHIFQYDKRHLFRLANEQNFFTSGNKTIVFDVKGWKIKPLVCYDLRFPVWSKNRYTNQSYEYDVLIYVANWPIFRSHVWKTLLLARAMENQAYVVGVNRIGKDGNGVPHSGDSMIIDPKGIPLYTALPDTEEIHCLSLEYNALTKYRKDIEIGPDWDRFSFNTEN